MPRNDGFAVGDRFRDTEAATDIKITAVGNACVLVTLGDAAEVKVTKRKLHSMLREGTLERLD